MAHTTTLDDKLHWYKDAIIYEIHIKAFCDGNDDGIGDFQGLMEKLDYLEELGVTAIWVLPFYPSPLKDDGYDIADYYSINSSYGNLKEFKNFLKEAHKRNLKVITELVINHTSDQHPWFQRARKSPKGSKERNYYVWSDDPEQYKDVRIIFQDFEKSNWTWDAEAQQYFWHRFFHHQPDLNYDNPVVQDEVFKIIDFWSKMGVDGFRLDAVPYLFEREGTNGENLPETHVFLKKLRAHVDENFPGTMLLAEANMWPEESAAYFGKGDECHMNYHFPAMPRMFMALQMEDKHPITDIFDQTPAIPETCQWAMFLRNHDELTLEMVTDEERDYMYKVYAKDPKARINLGIRHRLAPLMENDRKKIELMNSLLFSLPGTPVIYYGDEIGMGDNFYLGDRDGVRTPMQWSIDRNAGFSNANPQHLYLPTILDPAYHYESVNVETQRANTSSLFWYMKHIINIRKKYKAFGRGDMNFISVENPKVLAFTRTYKEETLLVVVNLSKFSQPAELDLANYAGYIPVEIFGRNSFPAIKENDPYFFTLGPHSFHWFILDPAYQQKEQKHVLPLLEVEHWKKLLENSNKEELENKIIPGYLYNTNWFSGKQKAIYTCKIVDHIAISIKEHTIYLLLVEINYKTGLPETYQLPLAFLKNKSAENLLQNFHEAALAKIKTGNEDGVLCDALYTPELQRWLFTNLASSQKISLQNSEVKFSGNAILKKYIKGHRQVRSRIHSAAGQNNTAITYDNNFFLKIYRKLDEGPQPDREMSQYLSVQAKFEFTPTYLGSVQWKFRNGLFSLGMMQTMVENHGNGHSFMMERLNNYIERILAKGKDCLHIDELMGTFTEPAGFDQLPEELQVLLGPRASDQCRLLGQRVGEMHLALADAKLQKDFIPERFSLHYQQSLYSAMQSLVRASYYSIQKNKQKLPAELQPEVEKLIAGKNELLNKLKRIYVSKIDVIKIRIHGNLSLRQVLLTGKDVAIHDFGGDPSRNYSERRIKRSPLRDVASMIRSFYYEGYEGFFTTTHVSKEEIKHLLPFAALWAHYMSGFFIKAYLETVKGSDFIPAAGEELAILLDNFILEKALLALNYELQNRQDHAVIPLKLLESIID
ncbi:MAG: maltose alpha-D-glucosyltransferase [Bacteroidia bacterium]|nr:maltose alpha-D-glucosyltransferase [Bacteroidia bacterium]